MSFASQTRVMFHCHTTYSNDGHITCSRLAELGQKHGFDFIFLSDHFEHLDALKYSELCRECRRINESSSCQLIPGYEKSWQGFHICAFHLPEWRTSQDFGQWCALVKESDGIIVAAHPAKYDFNIPAQFMEGCDAVEVWNSKWPYDGKLYPHPGSVSLCKNKIALAGHDVHKEADFNRLCVLIEGRCQSAAEVIEAIQEGRYKIFGNWLEYSSERSRRFSIPIRIYQRIRLAVLLAAFSARQKIRFLLGRS